MSADSNIEEPIYDSKYLIENSVLKRGLKKVSTKEIKSLGKKFHDNLGLVSNMIMLPHSILSLEHAKQSLIPHEILAAVKAKLEMRASRASDNDAHKYYSKARKEVFESEVLPKMQTMIDEAMAGGEKTLLGMLQEDQLNMRKTYKALLYSSTVWIWCSFEVLMKELWELALNIGGAHASKNVIKNLSKLEGFGSVDIVHGRHISLDYLQRYGFDLSNRLGSALSYKFDFTSLNGIKAAYLSAFPKSANIEGALDSKKINELEAARNVIVHNAGVIDEEFCKRTKTSKADIGKNLEVNSQQVSEYGNSTMDTGLRVMIAVSLIVSYAKSLKLKQKL